jgi:hypothetical protein
VIEHVAAPGPPGRLFFHTQSFSTGAEDVLVDATHLDDLLAALKGHWKCVEMEEHSCITSGDGCRWPQYSRARKTDVQIHLLLVGEEDRGPMLPGIPP